MTADKRIIASGHQYEGLFPKPSGKIVVVKKGASTSDTVAVMKKLVRDTLHETARIAPILQGKNIYETCQKIWVFFRTHYQYQQDPDGYEDVRSPARAWAERAQGIDCDCLTVSISSVLNNLKIPHKARRASYRENYENKGDELQYSHIYVVVPHEGREIILDCVSEAFNYEHPTLKQTDTDMTILRQLNGLPTSGSIDAHLAKNNGLGCTPDNSCGCGQKPMNGWLKDAVDKAKDAVVGVINQVGSTAVGTVFRNVRDEVRDGVQVVSKEFTTAGGKLIRLVNRYTNPGSITIRNGILICMKIDLFNVAERIKWGYISKDLALSKGLSSSSYDSAKQGLDKLEQLFYNLGGKKHNLKKAILNGKGNKGWGGSYVVPMDEATANNNEYEDEQELALTEGIILTPQELGLLCWAINNSRWVDGTAYTEVKNGKTVAKDYDWWKVYDLLRLKIYGSFTDAYPIQWNSRFYTRDFDGNKQDFLAIEGNATGQTTNYFYPFGAKTPAEVKARQNQILNDEKYLTDPYKGDVAFFKIVLGALGIVMPNALPAITDRNGNPVAGSMNGLGEAASTAIAIASASAAVGSIAVIIKDFKNPNCKMPSPPTLTGDANIDAIANSTYQAQVTACAAAQTASNLTTAVTTPKPASTTPAATTSTPPPSTAQTASNTQTPSAPATPPPPDQNREPNEPPASSGNGLIVAGILGAIGIAAVAMGMSSSDKPKSKKSSAMNGLPKGNNAKNGKKRLMAIHERAKDIRKNGEAYKHAVARASQQLFGKQRKKESTTINF